MTEPAARQRIRFVSESAIYGLILVSALLVVTGRHSDTSWGVFLKVLGAVLVFWVAHVFAHILAQLGEASEAPVTFGRAVRHAVDRSLGLLVVAIAPLTIVLLGALGVLGADTALWIALVTDAALLAVFGYLGFAHWTPRVPLRLLGAAVTAVLGVLIILMKVLIH